MQEIKRIISKFFSMKFLVTVFCCYLLHYRVFNVDNLGTVDIMLCSVPLSYMGLNVLQDFIFNGTNIKRGQ